MYADLIAVQSLLARAINPATSFPYFVVISLKVVSGIFCHAAGAIAPVESVDQDVTVVGSGVAIAPE